MVGIGSCLGPVSVAERSVECLSTRQEIGTRHLGVIVADGMPDIDGPGQSKGFVRFLMIIVQTAGVCFVTAGRHLLRSPGVVASGGSGIIEIVRCANERNICGACEPGREQSAQIPVFGAVTGLGIDNPPHVILFFQTNVHGQDFWSGGKSHFLVTDFLALVDLYVLDGIGADVFEHDVVVAVHKLLAVEQERLDELAVDLYLAIAAKLGAGKLGDECVEHRAFGEIEGVGVVDDCVTLVVEFDFGGCDCDLVERDRGAFQEDGGNRAVTLAFADVLEAIGHVYSLVTRTVHVENQGRVDARNSQIEGR